MKTILIAVCALLAISAANPCFSQKTKAEKKKEKAALIKSIVVDSQHYVFEPQTALPTTGGSRSLSYGYQLLVSKNKIESYLPYFGRAYTADYGSTQSPLEFNSTDFTYTLTDRKKGGWDIKIEYKDTKDGVKMMLTVFDSGSASLQVMSNNRQPISFNGYVEAVKPSKKDKD
jgi:hypothetical protein